MSESLDGVSVARTRQNAESVAYGLAAGPCPPPRPRPAAAASFAPRAAGVGAGGTNAPAGIVSADSIFACGNATDARFSHAVEAVAGVAIGAAADAGI